MNWLETATILVTGFVGSAEFASVALVHPVIRKLAPDDQLTFEKGLLKTYGRIMPIGMTAATVLAITVAIPTPSAWLISGFSLDEAGHADIRRQLDSRDAAAVPAE